ncbi:MAG: hypothetical protein DRI57_19625 [Deltaproteobacteria bacterium]|nr:MAG: hypothetical protein DRI57_19625 [Deltaproteobacteria bacterium]
MLTHFSLPFFRKWNESFWNKPEFDKILDDTRGNWILRNEKRCIKTRRKYFMRKGHPDPLSFQKATCFQEKYLRI